MDKYAVIGAGAGVGKYLANHFNAVPFCRGDNVDMLAGVNTIIFCAAKAHFETPFSELYASLQDNLLLLDRISSLPHKRFIYFSTVDVYPLTDTPHDESENIIIEQLQGGYASFKLLGEAIVQKRCINPVILRPTSLFGAGMRPNNILRLMLGHTENLSLTSEARFNCITYEMIASLIEVIEEQSISGIINCAAIGHVSLREIGEMCGYQGKYGRLDYSAPSVVNHKATSLLSDFGQSSRTIIENIYRSVKLGQF